MQCTGTFVRQTDFFSAGHNKNLQDRYKTMFVIKICLLRRVAGYLLDRLKISAGQNENLPVLSDSLAVFA